MADLNADPLIHGILVQLPLPKHLDEKAVIAAIDPDKDVDSLHVRQRRPCVARPARRWCRAPRGLHRSC